MSNDKTEKESQALSSAEISFLAMQQVAASSQLPEIQQFDALGTTAAEVFKTASDPSLSNALLRASESMQEERRRVLAKLEAFPTHLDIAESVYATDQFARSLEMSLNDARAVLANTANPYLATTKKEAEMRAAIAMQEIEDRELNRLNSMYKPCSFAGGMNAADEIAKNLLSSGMSFESVATVYENVLALDCVNKCMAANNLPVEFAAHAYSSERIQLLKRMALNGLSEPWEEFSSITRSPHENGTYAAAQELMKAEFKRQLDYEAAFRLPQTSEYAFLAQQAISGANELIGEVFNSNGRDLSGLMSGVHTAWLRAGGANRSAAAFAEIQAIGHLANSESPFNPAIGDLLRASLGDWRGVEEFTIENYVNPITRMESYLEHGLNPTLSDFPEPAFNQTLVIADLEDEDDEDDYSAKQIKRNVKSYEALIKFERQMRKFIIVAMTEEFGEQWMKRQLPDGMLERWNGKKATAEKCGAPDLHPIEYADFADYIQIIDRKDNWNKVFSSIFARREDVRESFQRLFPVRIATMHSRIVTFDDCLILKVETKRIKKAIRRRNASP